MKSLHPPHTYLHSLFSSAKAKSMSVIWSLKYNFYKRNKTPGENVDAAVFTITSVTCGTLPFQNSELCASLDSTFIARVKDGDFSLD